MLSMWKEGDIWADAGEERLLVPGATSAHLLSLAPGAPPRLRYRGGDDRGYADCRSGDLFYSASSQVPRKPVDMAWRQGFGGDDSFFDLPNSSRELARLIGEALEFVSKLCERRCRHGVLMW